MLRTAKFIHVVDSRVPEDPLSVQDEGLFNKLDDGDYLETGTMMNPTTGQIMAYEEIWRSLPCTTDNVVLLESSGDKDKTFLGRVGKWFQGIGTTEGQLNAVRQEYGHGTWRTVFSIGNMGRVPLIIGEVGWKVGEEIELGDRKWKILVCEIKSTRWTLINMYY